MPARVTKAIAATLVVFSLFSLLQVSFAQTDYRVSYQLLKLPGENAGYTVNIVVPQALLEYYREKSHLLIGLNDFAKFVTPYALKPVADTLREVYPEDEDFVNGALMIVHQMNYVETRQGKYPAETFTDNQGDCDIFSYVAASIIKAGGIDVVLLDYEEKTHMNMGVALLAPPENAREAVYKITHDNSDYYIAETTGGNWTRGWRVGECPDTVKLAEAQVLTLENAEQIAPGQVSASFEKLENSSLSLEIWPPITLEESTMSFRGSLAPRKPNENITVYVGVTGSPWAILGTAQTEADGSFEYTWKPNTAGIYAMRASWAGDGTFAGTTTEMLTTAVIPVFLGILIAAATITIIIAVIAVLAWGLTKRKNAAPIKPLPSSMS